MNIRAILGGPDNLILLAIGGMAMVYVATGEGAWSDKKWGRAVGAASSAVGLLKSGKLIGKKEGWDEGYNTLNPALHVEEIVRYQGPSVAGIVASEVASGVVEKALTMPGLPRSGPKDNKRHEERSEPKAKAEPKLPDGWRIDERGRFRDRGGRVASDERRIKALERVAEPKQQPNPRLAARAKRD
jgi:hypothetical protein